MKALRLTFAIGIALANLAAYAALNIPSDGSDGDLIITNDTVIDLSQAVTGNWDADNSANAGKGIYDATKWAVVFKYSSVTIQSGATVTFKNHPSHAPVVWLVGGDVIIDGTLSLNGQGYQTAPALPEPGPGGFRGGSGYFTSGVGHGAGFGPGGGSRRNSAYSTIGSGGSYGTVGGYGPATYGNPSVLPLLGGSGGGGGAYNGGVDRSGGAGGGAIQIACSGSLTVNGMVRANGGSGANNDGGRYSGGGTGGAIRLVAAQLSGDGSVQALGGGVFFAGGLGRIRLERAVNAANLTINPDPSIVPLEDGSTPLIWLPSDGPTARIVSIGEVNAPADPRASFGTVGQDVTLPQVSTTPVVVETVNAEAASVVTVRVTPRANGDYTETTATLTQTNSTSPLTLLWTANVPVSLGYSAVQVKVVRP